MRKYRKKNLVALLESHIKYGKTEKEILETVPVFRTRIFGGAFIKGALKEQALLQAREELQLVSSPELLDDVFLIGVQKVKEN
jgi:hypothetical protein